MSSKVGSGRCYTVAVALINFSFNVLYSFGGILHVYRANSSAKIQDSSKCTRVTSELISTSASISICSWIPIRNGNGASRTSIISQGSIGMSVCFQWKGNMIETKAIADCVSKLLCLDTSKTFLSNRSYTKISITSSTVRHLNRFSIQDLVA